MIRLPPNVTLSYSVKIIINELTDDMVEWFESIGGHTGTVSYYDSRGKEIIRPYVQYGTAKPSYNLQDGSGNVMLNFRGEDASSALMFMMKYNNEIVSHNMREYKDYAY